jgi:hypothetical protein
MRCKVRVEKVQMESVSKSCATRFVELLFFGLRVLEKLECK